MHLLGFIIRLCLKVITPITPLIRQLFGGWYYYVEFLKRLYAFDGDKEERYRNFDPMTFSLATLRPGDLYGMTHTSVCRNGEVIMQSRNVTQKCCSLFIL